MGDLKKNVRFILDKSGRQKYKMLIAVISTACIDVQFIYWSTGNILWNGSFLLIYFRIQEGSFLQRIQRQNLLLQWRTMAIQCIRWNMRLIGFIVKLNWLKFSGKCEGTRTIKQANIYGGWLKTKILRYAQDDNCQLLDLLYSLPSLCVFLIKS